MRLSPLRAVGLMLLFGAYPAVSEAGVSGVTYRTVILSGDAAPGTAPGARFSGFSDSKVFNLFSGPP